MSINNIVFYNNVLRASLWSYHNVSAKHAHCSAPRVGGGNFSVRRSILKVRSSPFSVQPEDAGERTVGTGGGFGDPALPVDAAGVPSFSHLWRCEKMAGKSLASQGLETQDIPEGCSYATLVRVGRVIGWWQGCGSSVRVRRKRAHVRYMNFNRERAHGRRLSGDASPYRLRTACVSGAQRVGRSVPAEPLKPSSCLKNSLRTLSDTAESSDFRFASHTPATTPCHQPITWAVQRVASASSKSVTLRASSLRLNGLAIKDVFFSGSPCSELTSDI